MASPRSNFIGVDVAGLRELQAKLKELPEAAVDDAIDEAGKYMMNVLQNQSYPPRKHVSRKSAYPETGDGFFTDRQRKWFFASLGDGSLKLPYGRSQTLRQGWKSYGMGHTLLIANETDYADLVMGDNEQSRMSGKIGWLKISEFVSDKMERLLEKADVGVKKAIKKLGL